MRHGVDASAGAQAQPKAQVQVQAQAQAQSQHPVRGSVQFSPRWWLNLLRFSFSFASPLVPLSYLASDIWARASGHRPHTSLTSDRGCCMTPHCLVYVYDMTMTLLLTPKD